MFFSLKNMIDFSLVKRLSSTGYQPVWEYLRVTLKASDLITISLFFYSLMRLRPWKPALWALLPILLLSFFQTKDERYLEPMLPFFLLCVAASIWHLLQIAARKQPGHMHVFLILALFAMTFLEVDGFRLRSARDAVDVAHRLKLEPNLRSIAMENAQLTGIRLYFPPAVRVISIDAGRFRERDYFSQMLSQSRSQYVVLKKETTQQDDVAAALAMKGYRQVAVPRLSANPYRVFKRFPKLRKTN
jgi:hypothetical protein